MTGFNALATRFSIAAGVGSAYGGVRLANVLGRRVVWRTIFRFVPSITVRVDGWPMLLNAKDEGLSRELWQYGTHEPISSGLLQGLLRPGQLVVDVGANIGYYTRLIGRCVGANGRVIAIEPDPVSFALLKKNVSASGLDGRVECLNVAAGGSPGTARLHRYRHANWNSMRAAPDMTPTGVIEVDVVTLDDLLAERNVPRVDWIRMDVEGYETEIFDGLTETLQRHRPHLVVEVHRPALGLEASTTFLQWLSAQGYEAYRVIAREKDYFSRGGPDDAVRMSIRDLIRSPAFRAGRSEFILFLSPSDGGVRRS